MKKLFLFFVALTCTVHLFAYDCLIDGIAYNLNKTDKTAEVTYEDYVGGFYSGSISIPTSIAYLSQTYSVTTIGYSAFVGCSDLTSVIIAVH